MVDPATITLAIKAAVTAATDKRFWKAIGVLIATILTPFILIIVMISSLLSGTANHNNSAVQLTFHGGTISRQVPADYQQYIEDMRKSFVNLDTTISKITPIIESGSLDPIQVKAIFYSLYFGLESLNEVDYQAFADSFVRYEERNRKRTDENGVNYDESYRVAVPIKSLPEIYARLEQTLSLPISYEKQANAAEIYSRALYGISSPGEGDDFEQWFDWKPESPSDLINDLPAGETGSKAVQLALSRLGDPYSQERRGQDNYTDCSYLIQWVYRQMKIKLPGTAAEQGKYCVNNGLTISKSALAPGDLVFWSHKVNGRYLNITHVGIYAGDGKVVDASSSKGKVVYRKLFDSDKQVLYARPYAKI